MTIKTSTFLLFNLLLIFSCKKEESIIVKENPPTVITKIASDVTLKNATLNGEVTDEGFSATSDRGFVFSDKNTNPSVSDTKVQSGYGKGVYSIVLDKLPVNTKYYFKAYATNTKGTSYGEVQNFTTADYKLPTIITDVPKNITFTTAQLTGTVSDDGGTGVTERGFVLNTSPNPTVANTKIANGNGLGVYTTIVSQLKEETIYFVRAYAINGKGTSYGNEVSFKTLAYLSPTIITGASSSIGTDIATLNGEVTNSGGTDITEKGFLFGTNPNVGFSDRKVISSSTEVGKYAIVLTNLKPNTKYYFRAYSINVKGSTLGEENSFSTLQGYTPTVSTNNFDRITETSVHTGLGIDNDGGSPITEYGICISATNQNPSISDRKVVFGNSVNKFPFGLMQVVAGLTRSTKYFVRGYAINAIGIAYGQSDSFFTLSSTPVSPAPVTPAPVTPPSTPNPSTPAPITPPTPAIEATTLKNGLLAFYPFNGNANDVTGNQHNGANYGGSMTNDRFGNSNSAMFFDGKSYVLAPLSNSSANLALSVWFLSSNTINFPIKSVTIHSIPEFNLIGFVDGTNRTTDAIGAFEFGGYNSIKLHYFHYPNRVEINTNQINSTNWHNVVYQRSDSFIEVYYDGVFQNRANIGTNPQNLTDLVIGKQWKTLQGLFFNGKVDDVGVWNRTLTAAEINYLYQFNFQP
jgi:hypothetical protein